MGRIVSFGMSAFLVFLAGVQSSSSRLGPSERIQTRDAVEKLYGAPVSEVYQTSENLTVTASYGSDGSLCRAHIRSDGDGEITDTQLNAVVGELVPEDVRGEFRMATFLDGTCLKLLKPEDSAPSEGGKPAIELAVDPCGECSGVCDDYERVNITKYGNTNEYSSVRITFHRAECKELDKAGH